MKVAITTTRKESLEDAVFITVTPEEAVSLCRSMLSQIENSSPSTGRLESTAELDSPSLTGNVYFSIFVKKEQTATETSRIWKGKVNTTLENLKAIGIDEDITGKEVTVFDRDKFFVGEECSHVEVETMISTLRFRNVYLVPTAWIEFL